MTAPTYVGDHQTSFDTTTTPRTVAVTAPSGALVIAAGLNSEVNDGNLSTPTGGPTWTQQEAQTTGLRCEARLWSATSTGNYTHSAASASPSNNFFGHSVWVWQDTDGLDDTNSGYDNSGAPNIDVVTTTDNCGLCYAGADWQALDGASRTWLSINGSAITEDLYFRDAGRYTVYVGHHPDVGAAGTKTAGLSAPSGSLETTHVVAAIKGTAGGAAYVRPTILVPTAAVHRASRW